MCLGIDCGTQGRKTLVIDEDGTERDHGYAARAIIKRAQSLMPLGCKLKRVC
jgi:sugar (pentulose or hexulose) kinase